MKEIPHHLLIQGVVRATKDVEAMLNDAQVKYGDRYNEKNDFEVFRRRFGYDDPEKIWNEFSLVYVKKSTLPAQLRKVINTLGNAARQYALQQMAAAQALNAKKVKK